MTNLEHLTIPPAAGDTFEVEVTDDGLVHLHLDPITAGHMAEAWWLCHARGHLAGRDIHTALEQTATLASHAGQAAHDHGLAHVADLLPSSIAHHQPQGTP